MMNIQVELKGKEELMKKFNKLSDDIKKEINQSIVKAGTNTQKEAKLRVPVRTGALRNSIMMQINEGIKGSISVTVGAYMPYASFVEYGTIYQRPKPYLMPAYEKAKRELEQKLKEIERKIENA